MWLIDLLQLTKQHLSFSNNQEQDVFLPLELSVETFDLLLPLNWSVWLIIWYFSEFLINHHLILWLQFLRRGTWFIGDIREDGGGEREARRYSRGKRLSEDTVGNICLIHHSHLLYKPQPWNMPTSGRFLSKLWQIDKTRRRWWGENKRDGVHGCFQFWVHQSTQGSSSQLGQQRVEF